VGDVVTLTVIRGVGSAQEETLELKATLAAATN
jgi:hypothetical protein